MFQLSVCADTMFLDHPFEDRVRLIRDAGFGVEFWRWTTHDIGVLAKIEGVTWTAFAGYTVGTALHPDGVSQFLAGVRQTIEAAERLGCSNLVLSTGELSDAGLPIHPIASHPFVRSATAYRAYSEIADLAERHDLTYQLEFLNTKVDHPGYEYALAEDVAAVVRSVGSPRFRLLYDIYHAQIQEGNLIDLTRSLKDVIGYVQVADVPGRHEPGTGEINWAPVIHALRETGYRGVVGLEAYPQTDPVDALTSFRQVFG